MRRQAAALIRLGLDEGSQQILQVEAMRGELLAEFIEQFRMARRVLLAGLVERVDDADAEQVSPDAIGGGASEVGVVGRRQSFRQGLARIVLLLPVRLAAVKKTRLDV